jgi:translocator protein
VYRRQLTKNLHPKEQELKMKMNNQWLVLAGFLVVTFVVAAIGGIATSGSVRAWYPALVKPSWNPPSWVFGPVWTLLYTMMAIAAWLAWRQAGWGGVLALYSVQLALNAAWSPLFFGLHRIDLALVDIVLLWVAIAATMVAFWRVTPVAGWLFVPYLVWVSFAMVLNFTIWRLNR